MTSKTGTARPILLTHKGKEPILVTAIHAGHGLRQELLEIIQLDEASRLREEDPFTDTWICIADNFILPQRSRFEIDLNRARDKAVYLSSEDAWGLSVWKSAPDAQMIEHSLGEYDAFYLQLASFLDQMQADYGHFVVYDLHAYNHRRKGPGAPPDDSQQNPEINVGTGTMDRNYWAPVVDSFICQLREFDFLGRQLEVRENVKFMGGYFPRWIHKHYPESACVISIEVKKFFMDEWSGMGDPVKIQALRQALSSTLPAVKNALEAL
jgi:N-formylglutamate amidohydrolase